MGFFKRLFNKVKRIGKQTLSNINRRIGKTLHSMSETTSPSQSLTYEERENILFMKQSYKPLNERVKAIRGYYIDYVDSNTTTTLYINQRLKDIKYVIRGSKTAQDWLNNLDILTGEYENNSRFKTDLDYFTKMFNKYKGYKFYLLGHSQGGTIVNYIASKYPSIQGMVFNAGAGLSNVKTPDNIKQVRATKDIVSLLGQNSNTKNIDLGNKDFIQSHSLTSI
jgi:triacylglycerol esterase/lipase EstA (alpha/beta hydrolase family)